MPTETAPRSLPSAESVRFVDVPDRRSLMIDGIGDPNSAPFQAAVEALYSVAYPLRFALKRKGIDRKVGALEGLWGSGLADDRDKPRSEWSWTLLIELPDEATDEDVAAVIDIARAKKKSPAIDDVRIDRIHEGTVAEILHVGPYATEGPTIDRLHTAIASDGHKPRGRHHEIYLGDPRRAAPDKLRTVLRQPVDRVDD